MLFGITFCAGTASLLTLFLQDDPVLRPAVPLLVLLVVIPIAISGHPCGYYRRNDCKSDVCRLAVSSLGQPCSTRSQRPDNSAFVSDRCDRRVASPFATIFHVTPLEQTRAIARIGSREPLLVESPSAPNYPRVEHVGNPWRNGHCGAIPPGSRSRLSWSPSSSGGGLFSETSLARKSLGRFRFLKFSDAQTLAAAFFTLSLRNSMTKRRQERTNGVLRVTISGSDERGWAFHEGAHTLSPATARRR
jgi:hypothetical protein